MDALSRAVLLPLRQRPYLRFTPASVALVLLLLLPGVGSPAAIHIATANGSVTAASTIACPVVTSPDAAARHIALSSPTFSISAGDALTVTLEYKATNTTLSPLDVRLNVPSFFAKFPLSNGTTLQFYLPPRTMHITNMSWTNASFATKTKTMTATTTFTTAKAVMTSELLSTMSTAPYGSLTLGFRWQWSVLFASNATTVTGPWSPLVLTGAHPNTFIPPPYVQLASTSNTTAAIGSSFTANVLGAISLTRFWSVLEYSSSGNVLRNTPTTTPSGNATADAISVTLLPLSGPMVPSTLLDHFRNVCGALLYSITIHSIYATSATVTFATSPSTCGPITFNGTAYASGSNVTRVPSGTSLVTSVASCPGHTFASWSSASGVYATPTTSNSTSTIVSASGTLTANFL